MREVFLSHAVRDHEAAQRLRRILVAHGVPVWFSAHHLRGAQQWQDEIGAALRRCGWFVVLLSPHSVKSMWVRREVNYALIEKRYAGRIIPLMLRSCDYEALSWTLPQFQFIDLRSDFRRGCEALLRIWKKTPKRDVLDSA